METMYFVAEAYRYKESHKWEYSIKGAYNNLVDAKQMYHSRMAAITKPSNDHEMVIVFDSDGNRVIGDFEDTYVEPEPNEGEG